VRCSVLQCVLIEMLQDDYINMICETYWLQQRLGKSMLQCVAVCCSVLQCVTIEVCCQCVAVCHD